MGFRVSTRPASSVFCGEGVNVAHRNPLAGDRSDGGSVFGTTSSQVSSFQDPPSIQRRPLSASFHVHSLTLPPMSYVPYGPSPRNSPTRAGPFFPKLLAGMIEGASGVAISAGASAARA